MKRRLELSPRLRLLAEWVSEDTSFADVGTDHAYLPVWLVLHGRVRSCIASDLRTEPLRRARETARIWDAPSVRFRLCNGLTGIQPEEAETIAIAGLGGENIAAILDHAPWTADGHHILLLQPMSRAEVLRRYLSEHGYRIRREKLALERETLYPVMEVTAGWESLSPGRQYGGAQLTHDPLGDRYLIERILRLTNAVAGLNRSAAPDSRERGDQMRDILTELLSMREEWRHANSTGD